MRASRRTLIADKVFTTWDTVMEIKPTKHILMKKLHHGVCLVQINDDHKFYATLLTNQIPDDQIKDENPNPWRPGTWDGQLNIYNITDRQWQQIDCNSITQFEDVTAVIKLDDTRC